MATRLEFLQSSAALPCLLALESLDRGKPPGWDATERTSEAL